MLNCSPVIDYQLVKWYILLSDAVVTEDVVEDDFGVKKVCTKDGIDGRQGTAEVFGHQVRRDAAGEGRAAIGEGRRSILQGLEMTDVCYKGRILVGDETFFCGIESVF